MLSWSEVERHLVEAVRYYWRSDRRALSGPGGRPGGFATDAPWRLLTREGRAEAGQMAVMDLWRIEQDEAVKDAKLRGLASSVPLTSEEVTWMDGRLAWLLLVPEADRKLVEVVVKAKARGAERIEWTRIRSRLPSDIGNKGLYRRYVRALQALARALGVEAAKVAA
jgi:hypothetical protein